MPAAVPDPPDDPEDLRTWAQAHGVAARLDDVIIGGHGPAGTTLPGRPGEALTFRQILLDGESGRRRYHDIEETARRLLHRMAELVAGQAATRARLDEAGGDPDDPVLAAFAARLRDALAAVTALPELVRRPPGTYEPLRVRVARDPVPMLRYQEATLVGAHAAGTEPDVALLLLGWNEEPPRWALYRGARPVSTEVSPEQQRSALEAMLDLLRDPEAAREQALLGELLRLPAWRYALGSLDERLSQLEGGVTDRRQAGAEERVAFRVTADGEGRLNVEPLLQKRGRSGTFSKGARLQWFHLAERDTLTAADRRAYQAYDDRFARRSDGWGAALTPAQVFGILRALVDHPAVFLDDPRAGHQEGGRLDIRQGRLRLRFVSAADGGLAPRFELLGATLLAPEVAQTLRDERHLIHLHFPEGGGPQVLLAQVTPQAAALVQALALAPARFPPEAHDALAARLESLQETVDIEFPSHWTRTIVPADGRLVARLELLASGAVQVRLAVRPVQRGPVFAPGEGPTLVLEGQGRDRHGVRRDRQAEREAAHALAERLGLGGGEEVEPWSWRVAEGDPALHLVATLQELADTVGVEWADDWRLIPLGTVGREQMRMKVADRHDWFAVEGHVEVPGGEGVPLSALFAAIREDRRYVAVGGRGFVRIEERLREALARAEAATFQSHGSIQASAVAAGALLALVEDEAQIAASAAFSALRRRMRQADAAATEPLVLPDALEAALRPYQKAGVAWLARLAHWQAGAVLADEMGLGKTVQTLAMLVQRAAGGPALVVAPTSVVPNWIAEAARFAPALRLRSYRGGARQAALRDLRPGDVVVTSYAVATLDAEALAAVTFETLVLDEAHAVKNATTERSKALRGLDARWRVGLTGTPIENHLGELWSLMRVVSPGLLGSWESFRARYAVPIEKFGDDARRRALAALLRPFVLRRTKAEVARELPPRTELVRRVTLSPDERALYEQLRQATIDELAAAKNDRDRDARDVRFVLLAALTRLRQLCCHPRLVYPRTQATSAKASLLLQLAGELREADHKVLAFSQFRSFLELLAPRLRQHGFRVLVLDGTTPAEVREQRIAAFQQGEADLFLISLKAGGVGLNLTAADTVIHLDPWWNPAVEDQATARAHRIGQDKPVTAIRLVARGTIEEAVLGLHAAKRALAAGVLEGSDVAATLTTDDLIALIRGAPAETGVW